MPWSFSPLRSAPSAPAAGRDSSPLLSPAGAGDTSSGSLGSLWAGEGRLSGSSTTLRAEDPAAEPPQPPPVPSVPPPVPPPPPSPVVMSEPGRRGTLAVPASGRAVLGLTPVEAAGARSRSRFYVRLDGGACCGGVEEEPTLGPAARSHFYRTLSEPEPDRPEVTPPLDPAAECDEGYSARTDAEDTVESAAMPTTPSLVITDTTVCAPICAGSPTPSPEPVSAGLAPPPTAVPQSRSCEPLSRPPPPPPAARRLSRSSADLRAPVRFMVGGDEDGADEEEVVTRRRGSRAAAGVSESSDDDSGFAGCERCSGRPLHAEPPPPPPPPPPRVPPLDGVGAGAVAGAVAGAGAGHAPLSRRHSDSIRDTFQYLRGYRSFRFSQPPSGRPVRKARHVSDGGSPSPPAGPAPPPEPPPPPPPPVGRSPCRCEEGSPPAGRLHHQTALLETGRGGPGRQSLSPWASLGGGDSVYVPDLALWGCVSRAAWEPRLRSDLQAAAGAGAAAGAECTCVLADTDSCSVQVLSSHSFPVCDGGGGGLSGLAVVFAPLVSGIVESVCRVQATGAPAGLVLHHLESQLAQLTARAAELAQFLINSSLANMQELTEVRGAHRGQRELTEVRASQREFTEVRGSSQRPEGANRGQSQSEGVHKCQRELTEVRGSSQRSE